MDIIVKCSDDTVMQTSNIVKSKNWNCLKNRLLKKSCSYNSMDSQNLRGILFSDTQVQYISQLKQMINKDYINIDIEDEKNMILNIIQKPYKNKYELQFMSKFLQQIQIFKNNPQLTYQDKIHSSLIDQFQYIVYPKHHVVASKGENANIFYIIISGSVNCLIQKINFAKPKDIQDISEEDDNNSDDDLIDQEQVNNNNINQEQLKKKLSSKHSQLFIPLQIPQLIDNKRHSRTTSLMQLLRRESLEKDYFNATFPKMEIAQVLKTSNYFGDMSILTGQKSQATYVCREETHFIALPKEHLETILGHQKLKMLNEQIDFLKSFNFLASLNNSQIMNFMHLCKQENFVKSSIIYTENDPSCFVFFIKSGEVSISQLTESDNQKQGHTFLKQKENKFRLQLVIKGKGCYFGEDEILKKLKKRITQASCISQTAEIYAIDKKKLVSFLKYNNTFEIFSSNNYLKTNFSENRVQLIKDVQITSQIEYNKLINKQMDYKNLTNIFNDNDQPTVQSEILSTTTKSSSIDKPIFQNRKLIFPQSMSSSQLLKTKNEQEKKSRKENDSKNPENLSLFSLAYAENMEQMLDKKQKLLDKLKKRNPQQQLNVENDLEKEVMNLLNNRSITNRQKANTINQQQYQLFQQNMSPTYNQQKRPSSSFNQFSKNEILTAKSNYSNNNNKLVQNSFVQQNNKENGQYANEQSEKDKIMHLKNKKQTQQNKKLNVRYKQDFVDENDYQTLQQNIRQQNEILQQQIMKKKNLIKSYIQQPQTTKSQQSNVQSEFLLVGAKKQLYDISNISSINNRTALNQILMQ